VPIYWSISYNSHHFRLFAAVATTTITIIITIFIGGHWRRRSRRWRRRGF
jgi:hypothetical protein